MKLNSYIKVEAKTERRESMLRTKNEHYYENKLQI